MTFPIEPILDRIFIKKDEEVKQGDFFIPESVKGRSRLGTVVAVGPGRLNTETGKYIPLTVKAGDRVFMKEFDGYYFDFEGVKYFVFTEADLIGKLIEGA